MAQITVTVNGRPVKEFVEQERNQEIQKFITQELRMMGRATRRHSVSGQAVRSTTKIEQVGNGSIRFA